MAATAGIVLANCTILLNNADSISILVICMYPFMEFKVWVDTGGKIQDV